jgi:hypothetical protein
MITVRISYVAELIARMTGDRKWVEQDESKVWKYEAILSYKCVNSNSIVHFLNLKTYHKQCNPNSPSSV